MSLKILFDLCNFLKCNPKDVYPEIGFYDRGLNIPTSQTEMQDKEIITDKVNDKIQDTKVVHVNNINN